MQFPNESAGYRDARDRLVEQEIALRRQTEAVAASRRDLPLGGEIPTDYVFEGLDDAGAIGSVKMSDLFASGKDSLLLYSFMYSLEMELPCEGCTPFIDGLSGAAQHINHTTNFAIAAKSPLPRILKVAKDRGWNNIRFLSSGGNTYNRDYFGEDANGDQITMMNVFTRRNGTIYHFWGSELQFAPADPVSTHDTLVGSICSGTCSI